MQVGQHVLYVPDKIHALNVNKDGTLAWEFHRKPGRAGPKVMSQDDVALAVKTSKVRRRSFTPEHSQPRCTWPATVEAVEGDKVTVLVEGPACQFIYTVPVDPNKGPHTVHEEQ